MLSGSLCGWGDVAISLFELVVYLAIPHDIRMARLRQRELARFGARILSGGDMYEKSQRFLRGQRRMTMVAWIYGVDGSMKRGLAWYHVLSSALKASTPPRNNWLC